jgi:hypothetical protein
MVALAAILLAALALVDSAPPRQPADVRFDREAWIEDYLQLRSEVALRYANLEWSVSTGRIDPYRLNVATLRALEAARTTREARRALIRFVDAFGDPHFWLLRPKTQPFWLQWLKGEAGTPGLITAPREACRVMGFTDRSAADLEFALHWGRRTFQPLPADLSFPAGILSVSGRRLGVLRIGSFDDKNYLGTCMRAWPEFRKGITGSCGNDCQNRFRTSFHRKLLEELVGRISELSRAGVDALLVDVTGNGGGHGWYLQAARLLTQRPIPSLREAFVRQEAALPELRDSLSRIASAMRSTEISDATRLWLTQGGSRTNALIQETRRPCDRQALFVRREYRLSCTALVSGEYYGDGAFAEIPRENSIPERLRSGLFDSYWGPIPEGSWAGPLLVLVDRETGSAAELFALELQSAGAAFVLGQRTAGSGGGYSFGQPELVLAHSRVRAPMPNSVAFLKDGRNAREGIEPDICVDWEADDAPAIRTLKLRRVLERM